MSRVARGVIPDESRKPWTSETTHIDFLDFRVPDGRRGTRRRGTRRASVERDRRIDDAIERVDRVDRGEAPSSMVARAPRDDDDDDEEKL